MRVLRERSRRRTPRHDRRRSSATGRSGRNATVGSGMRHTVRTGKWSAQRTLQNPAGEGDERIERRVGLASEVVGAAEGARERIPGGAGARRDSRSSGCRSRRPPNRRHCSRAVAHGMLLLSGGRRNVETMARSALAGAARSDTATRRCGRLQRAARQEPRPPTLAPRRQPQRADATGAGRYIDTAAGASSAVTAPAAARPGP